MAQITKVKRVGVHNVGKKVVPTQGKRAGGRFPSGKDRSDLHRMPAGGAGAV